MKDVDRGPFTEEALTEFVAKRWPGEIPERFTMLLGKAKIWTVDGQGQRRLRDATGAAG